MKIPFAYIWRSLWARRLTTVLTLTGLALVVFVFAGVLMLAQGLQQTLVDTGATDNVIVLRKAAGSELVSQVDRNTAEIIEASAEVAPAADGRPLMAREVNLLINLYKRGNHAMGNITVRGTSAHGVELRQSVHITQGRMFTFGTHEIVVGHSIATKFDGVALGTVVPFGGDKWTVVGLFDAGGTGFDSEIWADAEQVMQAFGRPNTYSSLTLRLRDPGQFAALKARLEADPRTQVIEPKRERDFYREQSQGLGGFIKVLGTVITVIFSFGAMIGAMITMYAAVANRVVEVGTMRALGFPRHSVLAAFLVESILLGLVGGGAGLVLAGFLSFARVSTLNFSSFSEIGFGFALSYGVIVNAMIFAVLMGIVGGFLPAVRAARLNIVNALRGA